MTITPRDGATKARPDLGAVVTVAEGTLNDVSVRSKGTSVPGDLSSDHTSWRTRWTLVPGRLYAVRATATSPNGQTTTASSTFTTQPALQTIAVSDVTPSPGETVGVGMPITVTFDRAVGNKDQVERALEVRSTKPALGAWRWVSDQQVIFRTQKYWQPHQRRLRHQRRHPAVPGRRRQPQPGRHQGPPHGRGPQWQAGARRRDQRGAGRLVDVHHHQRGARGDGKASPVVMTSAWMGVTDPAEPRYYKLTVYDAVQISSSGEYVHSAPWSVWAQGSTNLSHGCVNASPEFAAWFYGISQRGDIVTVTGTDRAGLGLADATSGLTEFARGFQPAPRGGADEARGRGGTV